MTRTVAERDDVIPVLAEVFRHHGYEGASIGIISARTGLGRSSLYHFFPGGKKEMATAVLTHVAQWFETNVFTILDSLPPPAAINKMLDAVTAYFEGGNRICLVGAFALDATRDQFTDAVRSYFNRWISSLAACLERLQPTVSDALFQARRIVATIQGGIILARATEHPETFHSLIDDLRIKPGANP
ncbi:TetR/AcrR family transcriptional regulator [Ruegeria profundi]|uniref:TetR/AcrR family transcriptional regulator n=1 Tax=Ruegeria profundi TaxID=1685378 RepID=UPI001CD27D8A|nr:TetR/AcrR family transcriptional regulator [Ruegeria profundi]MCA0928068.1 TetR/AcrR family transcriptional regulator [Ruegeria profundi]